MLGRVRHPDKPVVQLEGKTETMVFFLSRSGVLRRAFRCGGQATFFERKNVLETFTKKESFMAQHGWKNGRTQFLFFTCTFVTYCPHITFDGWACCSAGCSHLVRWDELGYLVAHAHWT